MERDYNNNNRGGGRFGGGSRGGGRYGGDPRSQQYQNPGRGGRGGDGGDQRPQHYQNTGRGGGGGRGGDGGGWIQQGGPRPQRGPPPPQYGSDQRPQQYPPQQQMGGGGRGGSQRPPQQYGEGSGVFRGDPGRGRGVSVAGRGPPRQQPPQQRSSQSMPDMQLLKISENIPKPSGPKAAQTDLFPVRRPDLGGTLTIRKPRLLVNHFPVKFNSNSIIIHYDIDIKLELPPEGRTPKISKIPKYHLRLIKEKLFVDNPSEFPLSSTAYDGEKNIYSAVPLPAGVFKVDFSIAEDMRTRSYVVTVKEVNRLKLSKLKDYLAGNVLIIPREVLQGMDVVMKENPSMCRISFGRSYYPVENKLEDDLKWGITASKGIQHSLKSTSQGLAMCLDYTVLAFRKKLPVIDYILEHFFGSRDLSCLGRIDRRDMIDALRGLKVNVTHRLTKQKYTIGALTDQSTRNTYFEVEEEGGTRRVSVVEYYREKYGREIVNQDIPCLDLGKPNKKNYVPMEFCVLIEGQRYPKEQLGKDGERTLKNMSLVKPHIRKNAICEMVQAADGPSGGEVLTNFDLQVVKEMTKVEARVIQPPQLKVGGSNLVTVDRDKCQWNLVGKSVVEGKSLERWALIDFSSNQRNPKFKLDYNRFIQNLRNRCQNLMINMDSPLVYKPTNMTPFSNPDTLQKLLESVIHEADQQRKGKLQMIVCVMSAVDPGYKTLKWLSETRIGVVTQCCLSGPANEGRDQYLANLAIKINAKLGGSNMELTDQFPTFPGEGPAMFIGADVNHPGQQNSSGSTRREDAPPSIAAVVGTMNWPAANRYAARVLPQYGRTEKIVNFGSMCKELIEAYARINKTKPQRIVVFRDGVSEGQFDMVINQELFDLKQAIYDEHYRPTITVVVAQKRHQTRLFPFGREDGGETGNVPPGTVVDKIITHPFEFDFYLCSHYGGLGTSKPTHYYVLYDDHNFTSDLLQKLIYDLCFTFARCTKPVSLVPPVYYADLVAYRGRMFQEVVAQMSPGSSSRSVASVSSSSTASSLDDQPYRLHPELENMMFFV